VQIGNKNHHQFVELLREYNFEPLLKSSEYSVEPEANASLFGHFYHLFTAKNLYPVAENFALSRSHEGLKGYLLTITSKEEENFIRDLLKKNDVESVWLGAHDSENEGQGEWKWNNVEGGSPEAGKVFYTKSDQGSEGSEKQNKPHSNWKEGEPNDADADEDCAVLGIDGWNDVRCGHVYTALVVEFGSAELLALDSSSDETLPKESHEEL
jgi:hypothetical protein